MDPVPESDSDEASSTSVPATGPRRPRALTAQSENNLTIFTNGHHKPVHKHNTMAHKCGLPYVVPRAHSIHGSSPAGLANRSVDNLPHTSTIDALHSESQIKDSMVSAQQEQRMVKSEQASPLLSPASNLEQLNGLLPPLDLSNISGEYNFMQNIDEFPGFDTEQPMFSAGLSAASIDWSHYDGLEFNNDDFGDSSYSQAPSFNGFDFSSIDQPALTTTSTSGEISEVEDFGNVADNAVNPFNNQQYGSDLDNSDFGGDIEGYRLSTASSYIGIPQSQMMANNSVDALDMEPFMKAPNNRFIPGISTSNDGLPITYRNEGKNAQVSPFEEETNFQLLPNEDEDTFWMNDFTSNANEIAIHGRSRQRGENSWAQ